MVSPELIQQIAQEEIAGKSVIREKLEISL
jgi:hypothetical protein